jgi:HSP20 family protein
MSLRDPWFELARLQERLHELVEQATGGRGGVGTGPAWRPAIDLVESPDAFLIYAELPGVRRENVELKVEDGWLELSGHRAPEPSGEQGFLRMESAQGSFRRRIQLPAPFDGDAVEARLRRGVLEIRVPKPGSDRSQIPVRAEEETER